METLFYLTTVAGHFPSACQASKPSSLKCMDAVSWQIGTVPSAVLAAVMRSHTNEE